jgi:hypothetical protein
VLRGRPRRASNAETSPAIPQLRETDLCACCRAQRVRETKLRYSTGDQNPCPDTDQPGFIVPIGRSTRSGVRVPQTKQVGDERLARALGEQPGGAWVTSIRGGCGLSRFASERHPERSRSSSSPIFDDPGLGIGLAPVFCSGSVWLLPHGRHATSARPGRDDAVCVAFAAPNQRCQHGDDEVYLTLSCRSGGAG